MRREKNDLTFFTECTERAKMFVSWQNLPNYLVNTTFHLAEDSSLPILLREDKICALLECRNLK